MQEMRHSHVYVIAFSFVVASLVFDSGIASAAIGTRNASATFSIDENRTGYVTGLTSSEATGVTGSNYLNIIKPYDAEKANSLADSRLCWAAATSNLLAYTGWGNVNGFQTEDDIFAYFTSNFTDFRGSADYGVEWFITGNYQPFGWNGWAQITTANTGGFWPDAGITMDGPILGYRNMSDEPGINSILTYLQGGYAIGLTVGWYEEGMRRGEHTVTVWGATYDNATGELVSLLISDSDDDKYDGVNAPDTLNELFLEYNANYYGFLNANWEKGRVDGFTYLASAVPEPPVYLLLGLGLITVGIVRRRAKH